MRAGLEFYFLEESLEFLGIWLTLVAALGHFSDALPNAASKAPRLAYSLPALALFAIVIYSLTPHIELRLLAQATAAEFRPGIHLRGYHIDQSADAIAARLYFQARQADLIGLGLSIHLVDQVSGESVASRDEWVDRQHGFWLFGPEYTPVFRQRMEVAIPPDAPTNRALWAVLTFWRKRGGEFTRQKVVDSDLRQLDDRQVVLAELVLPGAASAASPSVLAAFDSGFTLAAMDAPARAIVGETLPITFAWRSEVDSRQEFAQFLHFVDEQSGEWWGYDQQPLGPRLPTRLWYKGLADSETWRVPLPADLAPGDYAVYTGLYRVADQARSRAVDDAGQSWRDARVLLGSIRIESGAR